MNNKKLEITYDEDKLMGWCLGYSLGTFYKRSIKNGTIELWNFGYSLFDKEFYYTKSVHLPKEIRDYFNGAEYSEINIDKMEELGIYDGDRVDKLIEIYENAKKGIVTQKIEMEIEKQKILEFRRTLKKGKNNS